IVDIADCYARRERPGDRRTADERDELASSHSITSSARASKVGGTSRPSALAVLRLIKSSYLVGAWTGRSAGCSPLSIRSTSPAWRIWPSLRGVLAGCRRYYCGGFKPERLPTEA